LTKVPNIADSYFKRVNKWKTELLILREIIKRSGLTETIKWGQPCYMYSDKNVIMISAFKTNCVVSFFKGSGLKDPEQILEKPGENSQSVRVIRFTQANDIQRLEKILRLYIQEAIGAEISGIKPVNNALDKQQMPEEFESRLKKSPSLKKAFKSLTPGRQRAYLIYFAAAKQTATRESRIDQYTDRILKGYGFNDCICGLSKKMPACDGSHKLLKQK
jgi:uncharacterized protein YdeI (YjbR/CyaY-like superfamily)